jgi:GAF domain-containing protein
VDGSVVNRTPALFAGVEPLEVFVELLAELDVDTTATELYDRICEAICRLTTMRRAAIFMSEGKGHRVRTVGAHGTSFAQLAALRPTLLGTPIAQRALLRDEVIVVDQQEIRDAVPAEYVDKLGIATLVCTPLAAAGRTYGVICADRGGVEFELGDGERHLLWTLGKTAALVATARIATRQEEQSRRLSERLFGVSLALTAPTGLEDGGAERCRTELHEAIGELRAAVERPLAAIAADNGATLAAELERLAAVGVVGGAELAVSWPDGIVVPAACEQASQSFLTEAIRNAGKHAQPHRIEVVVGADDDTFTLEVRNDGVTAAPRGEGMGLRLAAFEALQHGGIVEYGDSEGGWWRTRLRLPV